MHFIILFIIGAIIGMIYRATTGKSIGKTKATKSNITGMFWLSFICIITLVVLVFFSVLFL